MKQSTDLESFTRFALPLVVFLAAAVIVPARAQDGGRGNLARLQRLHNDGNYAEAYDGLRSLVLSAETESGVLPQALELALNCLQQLNRTTEIDAFREAAVAAHSRDWRLLAAVAQSYIDWIHVGFLIGGEF